MPQAYIRYGTPEQEALGRVTASQMRAYAADGHFKAGSMGPKVEACLRFVDAGGESVIASLIEVGPALAGKAGTHIVPDAPAKARRSGTKAAASTAAKAPGKAAGTKKAAARKAPAKRTRRARHDRRRRRHRHHHRAAASRRRVTAATAARRSS